MVEKEKMLVILREVDTQRAESHHIKDHDA